MISVGSVKRSIDQSLDRSRSINHSIDQSTDQSFIHSIDQSPFRSVNHSINQFDHQSVTRLITREIECDRAINRPIDRSINQSKHVMFYNLFTCRNGCVVRRIFDFFQNLGKDRFYGHCGYNTCSYGHIRIGNELLRIERIDTEDLSAASVASVYASLTVL